MSEELLVNVTPLETRVALLEQGVLQELHIERAAHRGIAGNIYLGKVVRVLPGMEAAFVEIGEARTSFIHANDITAVDANGWEIRSASKRSISEHLREGQDLLVQVAKEPLGDKGARLTTQLSVSSRYLVYLPRTSHTGVSQQIEDEEERCRLRNLLQASAAAVGMDAGAGFIIRTAAEGVAAAELEADLRFLQRLWGAVTKRVSAGPAPQRIYEDWPLPQRAIRDMARSGLEKIRVDDAATAAALQQFCLDFVPEIAPLLEPYEGPLPLFEQYAVEAEISQALERKVELESGAHLVIDQTEAMTTIDINTGGFVGRSDPEETIYKTNLEAAVALARQVRVRNLGGIIIIDFIDMRQSEHRQQVLLALEKAMEGDTARVAITGVSELGLVEMTRKRTRESLGHVLCEPCPVCDGRGEMKSVETVCYDIFREILREARGNKAGGLRVLAAMEVVDRLLDEESTAMAELEQFIGKTVQIRVESVYRREHFDIIPF
ncbi:ribonuclease G [Halieaceae bacterium IMCC14734]|uniref:Ribonuclease G n=1 Tax=Candidatus Litorirhabdus singularis TaxID=2518993 RepID=A0ABT3TJH2_9GAMM|nr:ribonuclease G [Candidatus Litorirhabdus singularis]MCX2982465.1 ribonuclease G [Candidatus Litorirhabdus singularis]